MGQRVLTFASHLGPFVVEPVVLQRTAELAGHELIANGHAEQAGHVVTHLLVGQVGPNLLHHLLAQGRSQCGDGGGVAHRFSHRLDVGCRLSHLGDAQGVGLVGDVQARTELVATRNEQAVEPVVHAQHGAYAKSLLVDIQLHVQCLGRQTCGKHDFGFNIGNEVSTAETAIDVPAHTDCCRPVVVEPIGEVGLNAVDVLLSLHVGVQVVIIGSKSTGSEFGTNGHHQHGYAFVVGHLAATAHDASHHRQGPPVVPVRGKQSRYEGIGRSLALELMLLEAHSRCVGLGECGLDVAVLVGLLHVQRQLPSVVPPGQSGRVAVGGIDVDAGATCHHAIEGDVVVGVGHQTASLC